MLNNIIPIDTDTTALCNVHFDKMRLYFICNFQEIDVSFNGCFPGNFSKMLRNAGTELQAEAVSSPLTTIRVKW